MEPEQDIRRLLELLDRYADHDQACESRKLRLCTCGWREATAELVEIEARLPAREEA